MDLLLFYGCFLMERWWHRLNGRPFGFAQGRRGFGRYAPNYCTEENEGKRVARRDSLYFPSIKTQGKLAQHRQLLFCTRRRREEEIDGLRFGRMLRDGARKGAVPRLSCWRKEASPFALLLTPKHSTSPSHVPYEFLVLLHLLQMVFGYTQHIAHFV